MQRAEYHAEYGKQYRENVKRPRLTFSEEEFRQIEELAKSLELKPAVFLKRLVLSAMKGTTLQSEESLQDFQEIRFLLRNIANNLNQIAKHSNTVGYVLDENQVLQNIRDFEETTSDFVEKKQKSRGGV